MTDDRDVIDTIQLVYFLTHPAHLFLAAHSMSYKPLKGLTTTSVTAATDQLCLDQSETSIRSIRDH